MSWAEVKKINSDLSTPLDVLIKGDKQLVASNVAIGYVVSDVGRRAFVPELDGTVRFATTVTKVYGDRTASLHVYENGVKILEGASSGNVAVGESQEISAVINVTKGNRYWAELAYGGSGTGSYSSNGIAVCVQIMDKGFFDLEAR